MSFGIPSTDVQTFTTPGANTWTKPQGAKWVRVLMIAGGAGGNAGVVTAPGASAGVSGGSGGGYAEYDIDAAQLGATESVTVGAKGAGGVAPGGAGGNGTASKFGKYYFTRFGAPSAVNTQGQGFPSAGAANWTFAGGNPNLNSGFSGRAGCAGGAGGGFVSAVGTVAGTAGASNAPPSNSTVGGINPTGAETPAAGGTLGAPNGGDGNAFTPGAVSGGTGGGGGASNIAANGGNGGKGANYGAGGGAGGNAFTGFTAGNGGDGAPGIVSVTTFF